MSRPQIPSIRLAQVNAFRAEPDPHRFHPARAKTNSLQATHVAAGCPELPQIPQILHALPSPVFSYRSFSGSTPAPPLHRRSRKLLLTSTSALSPQLQTLTSLHRIVNRTCLLHYTCGVAETSTIRRLETAAPLTFAISIVTICSLYALHDERARGRRAEGAKYLCPEPLRHEGACGLRPLRKDMPRIPALNVMRPRRKSSNENLVACGAGTRHLGL
jgi:hypothetical protein